MQTSWQGKERCEYTSSKRGLNDLLVQVHRVLLVGWGHAKQEELLAADCGKRLSEHLVRQTCMT